MQRGAQKRSSEPPVSMQEIYKKHPPKIASLDKPHLDFQKYGKPEQLTRIRTVIEAAKKNGIGTASEISRLLNKLTIKTAIGEQWTPRLAWFAARAVFDETSREADTKPYQKFEHQSRETTKFQDRVNRLVKSRLDAIRSDFEDSKPTLGDVSAELAALKKTLEGQKD